MQRTTFLLDGELQMGYEEKRQMELRTELSPLNDKEDNSSEPKVVVSMKPAYYSDIVTISVLGKSGGEPVRDFMLKLSKDYLTLTQLAQNGDEQLLYQEDTSELLEDINRY